MAFDPYHKWLGISPKDQPPDHYRLLGIDLFESDPDVIQCTADQRMAHVRSFQAGKHSDRSQDILNEIAAAKLCLLKPEDKEKYDRQLRQKMGPGAARPAAPKVPPQRSAPLGMNLGSRTQTSPERSETGPPGQSERKALSWQIPAAVVGAVAVIGLAFMLVMSGPPSDEDPQAAARDPELPKPPVARPSPPQPSPPVEEVEPPADPAADPVEDPPELPVDQEPVKKPADPPPVEVPKEPLPPEKLDPPEVVGAAEETVEAAEKRIRKELGTCESEDDYVKAVDEALAVCDRAAVADDIRLARELAAVVLAAARKSEQPGLVTEATLRVIELQGSLQEIQDAARERVKEKKEAEEAERKAAARPRPQPHRTGHRSHKGYSLVNRNTIVDEFTIEGPWDVGQRGLVLTPRDNGRSKATSKAVYSHSSPLAVEYHVFLDPRQEFDFYAGFAGIRFDHDGSYNTVTLAKSRGKQRVRLPHQKADRGGFYRIELSIDEQRTLVIRMGAAALKEIHRRQLDEEVSLTGPVYVGVSSGQVDFRMLIVRTGDWAIRR